MAATTSSGPPKVSGQADTDTPGHGPHTNRDQDTNGFPASATGPPDAANGHPRSSGTAEQQQFRSPPGYSRSGSGSSQQGRPPSSGDNSRHHHQAAAPEQQQQQAVRRGAPPYIPPHQHNNNSLNPYAPYCPPYMQQQYPTAAADEASAAASDMFGQQQQQLGSDAASPLPEAAPAPKTDPVELSLLASYLEVVRQTQGEAAAAEAMAASGLPAGVTAAAVIGQSPFLAAAGDQQHDADGAEAPVGSLSAAAAAPGSAATGNAAGPFDSSTAAEAAEEQLAVNNLLGFIKQRKLTGMPPQQQQRRSSSSSSIGSSSSAGGAAGGAAGAAAARKIWIQPSGPRRPGEGVENEEQGILSAEEVPATGEVMMRITLLAAGFVIGPSGASVREVVRLSGADINSWTEAAGTHRGRRPARIFVIKGEARCIAQALYIITAAVDRYKELCEGRYTGQSVPRSQNVLGVTFSYQPPPKSIVPCAASLKELYPPAHTTSAAHAAKFGSPPGLYGQAASRMGMRPGQGGPCGPTPSPYDPNTWAAMMTAAAAMGMNPLAALAAAGGNPAGFNPFSGYNPFNPTAAASFMGGFGQNPMAGLGSGGLDPMQNAMGGLNPMAFGMNPMLGGTSLMGGPVGDMFGPGAALFGGGPGAGMPGMGAAAVSAAGGTVNSPVEGSAAGYGGPWGSGMFDPSSMSHLMGGLYGMMAGGFDPAAGGGYDPMAAAAMAAAGFDPTAVLAAGGAGEDPAAAAAAAAAAGLSGAPGGYGALLNSGHTAMTQQQADAAASLTGDYAAGSPSAGVGSAARPRRLSRAGSSGSGRANSSREAAAVEGDAAAAGGAGGSYPNEDGGEAVVTPRGPSSHSNSQVADPNGGSSSVGRASIGYRDRSAAAAGGGSSSAPSSGARPPPPAAGSWPPAGPPMPFMAGPGQLGSPHLRRGAPALAPLMILSNASNAAAAGDHSSARADTRADSSDTPTSPPAAGPSPGAYQPPQSPGGAMPLGPFGPLFHPLSPGGPYGLPYGPLPGMPPYVPPSPVRIMRDKSGAAVPYMEVGGTVYFSPASPMPPHVAGLFSPPGGEFPGELQGEAGCQQQGGTDGDAAAGSSSTGAEAAAGRGAGGSRRGGGGSGGRPRSGNTPMRMAAALKLLEDNPYLVQDAIGSGHGTSGHYSHGSSYHGGGPEGEQRSGGGGRGYGGYGAQRGFGARSSPSPRGAQRHMQWQQKRTAGSSNSVGNSGMPASGNSRDGGDGGGRSPAQRLASGNRAGVGSTAVSGHSPDSSGNPRGSSAGVGGAEAPRFDAAAITAALTLPGSHEESSSSSGGGRANVRKVSGRASDYSGPTRDSSVRMSDQQDSPTGAAGAPDSFGPDSASESGGGAARTNAPMGATNSSGGSMGGRSPSMTLLSTIPEASTAGNSPQGAGPAGRTGRQGHPYQQHQLNAHDPIVSPGRITLASKVKAARLYSSGATRGNSSSPGSE